jgi:biotin operon repressor
METCKECQKPLLRDEIAIYRRLIHREAEEYLCKECLAAFLGVPTEIIEKRIAYFKKIGCTLF